MDGAALNTPEQPVIADRDAYLVVPVGVRAVASPADARLGGRLADGAGELRSCAAAAVARPVPGRQHEEAGEVLFHLQCGTGKGGPGSSAGPRSRQGH